MADDLDWNAIIAPAGDGGRRRHGDDAESDTDRPLSRREVRAREEAARDAAARVEAARDAATRDAAARDEAARGAAAHDAGSGTAATASDRAAGPMGTSEQASRRDRERPVSPADAPVATSADELHPEVTALLTGEHVVPQDEVSRAAEARAGAGRGGGGRASRPGREPRPPRRRGPLVAGLVIVAIVVAGGVAGYQFIAPKVQQVIAAVTGAQESDDYSGDGTGKVTITIRQGDIGEDVAKTLQRSDVVKSSKVFYKHLLQSPEVQFQPGSYTLKKEMSSKAALSALQDPKNAVKASIVIPEGTALKDIEAGMVSKAGLTEAEVSAAAKDVSAYGLPANATTLEGWLFPATYPINPGWTAKQYFQSMVDTMKEHLASAGVAEKDQERVIVFASLVQKEAGLAADYPKVARVFQNRLDDGMALQSDATVAYGTGNTHRVTTTDAERADASNKYNTYVHKGLPPAPISNPGDVAIKAVTNMAQGKWLFFVTVNLETGETVFSDTYAEHQVAVAQFQAWLRAHPDYQ
ncbi:MAG: endolytic transglycosylase MltG [Curtobacterium sp.]